MRKVDLFITDANLEPIVNFTFRDLDVKNWDDETTINIAKKIKELNEE